MKKGFGTIVVIVGIVSLVISGIFFYQGVSKADLIVSAMQDEKVEYAKAEGHIWHSFSLQCNEIS